MERLKCYTVKRHLNESVSECETKVKSVVLNCKFGEELKIQPFCSSRDIWQRKYKQKKRTAGKEVSRSAGKDIFRSTSKKGFSPDK